MKKIYILIAASMLCMASQARELTFYIGDTPITPGTTVNFKDIEVIDYDTYKEVRMEPNISVACDIYTSSLSVTATCTSGQSIQMCAGGSCEAGTSVTKQGIRVQSNQKMPLVFDYIAELDNDEEIPTVVTTFEAVDVEYEETRTTFTLVMGVNASVTLIEAIDELCLTPAGIEYNVPEATALSLYTLDGQLVYSTTVGGSGLLPTTSFQAGVYVYALGDKTGKIYIK